MFDGVLNTPLMSNVKFYQIRRYFAVVSLTWNMFIYPHFLVLRVKDIWLKAPSPS